MKSQKLLLSLLIVFCTITTFAQKRDLKPDFFDTINNRRSVRNYYSTPVPQEDIDKILNAAIQAPSSGNQQPWKFVIIKSPKQIEALKKKSIELRVENKRSQAGITEERLKEYKEKITDYITGFLSAPVYIVVLTDDNSKWSSYNHHDGPLAAANILLAARSLGYGTVYATDSIPVEATNAVCNIPDNYTRVCLIPIGIPVEYPKSHGRKELKEFVVNDSF